MHVPCKMFCTFVEMALKMKILLSLHHGLFASKIKFEEIKSKHETQSEKQATRQKEIN